MPKSSVIVGISCVFGLSPRDVLSPNSPQQLAGIRIEPPPSEACAIGTIPAATAEAEPPLDPPGVRSAFQGLRQGPNSSGSVTGTRPSSGTLVLPKATRPAALNLFMSSPSSFGM